MKSLENLAIWQFEILAKVGSIDSYQNMLREQEESIFTAFFLSKP